MTLKNIMKDFYISKKHKFNKKKKDILYKRFMKHVSSFIGRALLLCVVGMILSPCLIGQMARQPYPQRSSVSQSLGTDSYDLLVLAPDKFIDSLQPLVIHKETHNIKTTLVSLSTMYEEISEYGRDNPEKIKYYIKYAIETWGIKYVLLVGDFIQMPIRYCSNSDMFPGYPEPSFISELYYADIYEKNGNFSSWDTNGNGIYGEWSGSEAQDKEIDLYPDVYVGRLACRNNFEVQVMVNKIITYENTAHDKEWFNRMVVVAGDTYPPGYYNFSTASFEGEESTQTALDYMPGFEAIKLWTSLGTLTEPGDVIKAIDNGCGFLFFEGHGNPMNWATHPPNDEHNWTNGLSIGDMGKLKNTEMYPICVVGGCHNSEFDVALINLLKDPKARFYGTFAPECWSWKLTRIKGGGSIATIGNTALGMSKEDKESMQGAGDVMDVQLFYEYGVNGTRILGDAWGHAITNYLHEYPINWSTPSAKDSAIDAKTVQEWVLFGDPSLRIGGYP